VGTSEKDLVGWRVASRERLLRRFVYGSVFGSADLCFGLKPVVKLRAGLLASLEVDFVSSSPDSSFARKGPSHGLSGRFVHVHRLATSSRFMPSYSTAVPSRHELPCALQSPIASSQQAKSSSGLLR
jgi:hypothetical protein